MHVRAVAVLVVATTLAAAEGTVTDTTAWTRSLRTIALISFIAVSINR